jgi:uncharacterized membrane protein YjgN (DUF898 family)
VTEPGAEAIKHIPSAGAIDGSRSTGRLDDNRHTGVIDNEGSDGDIDAIPAAAPAPSVAPRSPAAPRAIAFAFTGRTREYFRIWIVSLALSIVTAGVYSAWGKVRKKRYLLHHTRVAGDGFDFRGTPLAILRGRIIAVMLFGGIALGRHVMIELQLAFIALLVLLTPWIAVASARFNARNTLYRNVAFDFDGRLWTAVKVFLGFGALAIVTLGLAYPWFRARRARFLVGGHRYGATPFVAAVETGDFVLMYLLASLAFVGCIVALIAATTATTVAQGPPGSGATPAGGFYAGLALFYAIYIVIFAFVRARTQNLIANGTIVGPIRLESRLRGTRLSWLYVTNIFAVIGTLGLATPWAVVRLARYRAATLTLVTTAPLEALPVATAGSASATASEVSDLFDVDVAL